jgi:hypothetical protein
MDNKITEFENYLTKQINRTYERLEEAKAELKKNIDGESSNILNFGLAKYAENITKLQIKLETLQNMENDFNNIFELK